MASYTPSTQYRNARLPSKRAGAVGALILVVAFAGAIGIMHRTASAPVSAGVAFTNADAAQVSGHAISEESGRVNSVGDAAGAAPASTSVVLPRVQSAQISGHAASEEAGRSTATPVTTPLLSQAQAAQISGHSISEEAGRSAATPPLPRAEAIAALSSGPGSVGLGGPLAAAGANGG